MICHIAATSVVSAPAGIIKTLDFSIADSNKKKRLLTMMYEVDTHVNFPKKTFFLSIPH